jgi:hypothetical protein
MESPLLGLILDSSVILAAERKRQTVEQLLTSVGQAFGEVELRSRRLRLLNLSTEWPEPTHQRSESRAARSSMN